jgi:adenylate cyclase
MAQGLDSIRQRTPGIVLGLAAIAVCLALRALGLLEGPELAFHDRFVRQNVGTADGAPLVVGVSIGEKEFARYGYPIPDEVLARALEALGAAGASAIGLDLYRSGPASASPEDLAGWRAFARVVKRDPRIVVSELLPTGDEPGTPPPPFLQDEPRAGFNNLLIDRGRFVRRGYLIDWDDEGVARLSLSLRLALLHLADRGLGLSPVPGRPDWVRLGGTPIPPLEPDFGAYVDLDAGGYQYAIDYARADASFETVTLAEVLEGRVEAGRIAGRVALVGTDAPSVKDDFNAPFAAGRAVKGYRLHAHLTDQLIRIATDGAAPRGDWSEGLESAWIIGWGLAGIALSVGIGTLGWAVPGLLVGLGVLYLANASLFASGLWVPTVAPALAWVSAGGLALGDRARREARAQRQVMGLFRRFASRPVADALWRQRDEFMEGGRPKPQRVTITALLSDLKGYTEAAEKMEPDDLMAWIDAYMDAMTRVIEAHEGHVDDYVGDAIKANFGVPIPSETPEAIGADAARAIRCAIAMGATLERLNAEWARRGWPTARQRIGIHTGTAVVGAIGSDERLKYTSVGDTINTAARLESLGGSLDFDREESLQRILIGESTRAVVGDAFEVADLGEFSVKGKSEPLRVFRVLGESAPGAREGER